MHSKLALCVPSQPSIVPRAAQSRIPRQRGGEDSVVRVGAVYALVCRLRGERITGPSVLVLVTGHQDQGDELPKREFGHKTSL